ncbi:MAG: DUF6116 family protein [Pseudomonadales bacterium]
MNIPVATALLAWARKLRFRQLFWLTGALFVADLFIPDFVPFADEVLLGLLTLLFASWKDKRHTAADTDESVIALGQVNDSESSR